MEKGIVFAVLAAACFAGNAVYVRKAAYETGESLTPVLVQVFMGVPFFAVSLFFSGGWDRIWYVSWQAFILLGAAGVVHFIAGRLLAYNAYRLLGVNKSSAFLRTSPVYAVIFAVFFLNEHVTTFIILGTLSIIVGAALVSMERKTFMDKKHKGVSSAEVKGIVSGLGGALCWGISPILIRAVAEEVGSPFVGGFISYVVASIVASFFLLRREHRQQMAQLRLGSALVPLLISGIFVSTAVLLFYTALTYSPAVMVVPLLGTIVFFIYIFSFLVNRKIEVFTPKVISGLVVTAIGAFLIVG